MPDTPRFNPRIGLHVPGLTDPIRLTETCWASPHDTDVCPRCHDSGVALTSNGEALRELAEFVAWLSQQRLNQNMP